MTATKRVGIIVAIVLAAAGLVGVTALAVAQGPWTRPDVTNTGRYGPGMGGGYGMRGGPGMGGGFGMGGGGMMRGAGLPDGYAISGTGPVADLGQARTAARRFADRLDLRVGEVMRFSDNYYAELLTAQGKGATEVLVDPATGDVRVEYGPAMMWNTEYGMHASGTTPSARISPAEARRLADQWLAGQQNGTTAGEPETFPGYYTLHTLRSGEVTGMLSVNAATGAVWYHWWHGAFEGMADG